MRKIIITVSASDEDTSREVTAFVVSQLRGQNIIAAVNGDEHKINMLAGDDYALGRAVGKIAISQTKPLEEQDQVAITDAGVIPKFTNPEE